MKTIPSNISNAELSALVAREHGWTNIHVGYGHPPDFTKNRGFAVVANAIPPFAESLDAVLPLAGDDWSLIRHKDGYEFEIAGSYEKCATSDTASKACCFALLAAHGYTVEDAK